MTGAELVKVRAIDAMPYRWAMWCSIADGKPFANLIVLRGATDDGRIRFMLDTHNFFCASPDEALDLVPIDLDRDAEVQERFEADDARRMQPLRDAKVLDLRVGTMTDARLVAARARHGVPADGVSDEQWNATPRPAVGAVCDWDTASRDMRDHPEARWDKAQYLHGNDYAHKTSGFRMIGNALQLWRMAPDRDWQTRDDQRPESCEWQRLRDNCETFDLVAKAQSVIVYVAAASAEITRAESFMRELRAAGIEVAHDWPAVVRAAGSANEGLDPEDAYAAAKGCVEGVKRANWLVLLEPWDADTTIGAWVELGYAHALDVPILYVGKGDKTIFAQLATHAEKYDVQALRLLREHATARTPAR